MKPWPHALLVCTALALAGCSEQSAVAQPSGAEGVVIERGAPIDAPVPAPRDDGVLDAARQSVADDIVALGGLDPTAVQRIEDSKGAEAPGDGYTALAWRDLNMQDLPMDDLLDTLLYPDEYEDGELEFPDRIAKHDGTDIAIVGYMIPLEWKKTTVPEFMLVRDLLGCCFGGAPMPDEWISVKMEDVGAEYFPYIPVVVKGRFRIEGIEDEAGYAAGCFHIAGHSVEKDS